MIVFPFTKSVFFIDVDDLCYDTCHNPTASEENVNKLYQLIIDHLETIDKSRQFWTNGE